MQREGLLPREFAALERPARYGCARGLAVSNSDSQHFWKRTSSSETLAISTLWFNKSFANLHAAGLIKPGGGANILTLSGSENVRWDWNSEKLMPIIEEIGVSSISRMPLVSSSFRLDSASETWPARAILAFRPDESSASRNT
jgi:hypothetical protein